MSWINSISCDNINTGILQQIAKVISVVGIEFVLNVRVQLNLDYVLRVGRGVNDFKPSEMSGWFI